VAVARAGIYEETLKILKPAERTVSYTASDMLAFLDGLHDISCLVLDPASGKYDPHPRDYVKSNVFNHLKAIASRG
jgi:hypothetical protein